MLNTIDSIVSALNELRDVCEAVQNREVMLEATVSYLKETVESVSAKRDELELKIVELNKELANAASSSVSVSPRRVFPADTVIDVRRYGAKGDGITDDTDAIQRAISEALISTTEFKTANNPRTVYFPAGTYVVSRTLFWRDIHNRWQCYLTLQGEGHGHSVIRLKDGVYTDTSARRAVIYTASIGGDAFYSQWSINGEGNRAFQNNIYDLTIDLGNNPGSVGIDYLANNKAAIRNVRITGKGYAGISMTRRFPGPCLLQDVVIDGPDIGIEISRMDYGVTLDRVRAGKIINTDNVLSCRDSVYSIASRTRFSMEVDADNVPSVPNYWQYDLSEWEPVRGTDERAMQAAMNSGLPVVYLTARVRLNGPVRIPSHVRHLICMDNGVSLSEAFNTTRTPAFIIEGDRIPLTVERFYGYAHPDRLGALWFDHQGRRTFILRDARIDGGVKYAGNGQTVFLDNVDLSDKGPDNVDIRFTRNTVYALQLNVERSPIGVLNDGGTVVVVGLKTEQMGTAIQTINGGRTYVYGGLLHQSSKPTNNLPAFQASHDSSLVLRLVESAHKLENAYDPLIVHRSTVRRADLNSPRGNGTFIRYSVV